MSVAPHTHKKQTIKNIIIKINIGTILKYSGTARGASSDP